MTNQVTPPSLSKLDNSVNGSPEDADRRQGQGGQEAFEFPILAQRCEDGVLVECSITQRIEAATGSKAKVEAEAYEDEEREDLERQACNHYVITCIGAIAFVRGIRGNGAASSLEEETQKIARDELY